ncbi:uncharacterized protein SCHCODRAFT_01176486 [Schizophyllum commune H4-8]|nr:uncharacterized protein SCHCODRAFT_01176486 [Schizophyllum commune H4-8]KAI5885598.1 hypothetical protein SCHCODRAFT_01176486 [Schizophyllum commune H4-8]
MTDRRSLPFELEGAIMRFCDRQSLALLMRVSPDFLERARPLFYEVLCFTHPLDVVHLSGTPLALSFVRVLTAHLGAELLQLPALPNLQTLSWTHDAWPGHEKPLNARSVRAFLPRFQSLRHLALSLSLLTVPKLDFVLAPISARLLSLKVVCVVHGPMDHCRARPRSCFSNLRVLFVDDPRYGELSGSVFSCLTRGNRCLQTIRFPRDTTWASIKTALWHSPPSVSSLEFEGCLPLVRLAPTYDTSQWFRLRSLSFRVALEPHQSLRVWSETSEFFDLVYGVPLAPSLTAVTVTIDGRRASWDMVTDGGGPLFDMNGHGGALDWHSWFAALGGRCTLHLNVYTSAEEGTSAFSAITLGVARTVPFPHTAVVFANRPVAVLSRLRSADVLRPKVHVELFDVIVSFCDRNTLLALVCSAQHFHYLLRRFYDTVHIWTPQDALTLDDRKDVAEFVHELIVHTYRLPCYLSGFDNLHTLEWCPPPNVPLYDVRRRLPPFLRLFSGLRHLRLAYKTFGLRELDVALRDCSANLVSLAVSFKVFAPYASMQGTSSTFPALRELTVRHCLAEDYSHFTTDYFRAHARGLEILDIPQGLTWSALDGLLSHSPPMLKELRLGPVPAVDPPLPWALGPSGQRSLRRLQVVQFTMRRVHDDGRREWRRLATFLRTERTRGNLLSLRTVRVCVLATAMERITGVNWCLTLFSAVQESDSVRWDTWASDVLGDSVSLDIVFVVDFDVDGEHAIALRRTVLHHLQVVPPERLTLRIVVQRSPSSQPIPLEIQHLVADSADRPTLASLMRVTKALHRDISPLFFRTLVIRSLSQAKELKARPSLGKHILSLDVHLYLPPESLPPLPNVRSLYWRFNRRGVDAGMTPEHAATFLQQFPQLQSLRLDCDFCDTAELDVALRHVSRQITSLEITFSSVFFDTESISSPSSVYHQLRTLNLADGRYCNVGAFVEKYISPSAPHLSRLRIPRYCDWDGLCGALRAVASSLTHLDVEWFNDILFYDTRPMPVFPRLSTVLFEVHNANDELRQEWDFMRDFMHAFRYREQHNLQHLHTIAITVYARNAVPCLLIGDWEYALFREGDGPSEIDWARWATVVLGQSRVLRLEIRPPFAASSPEIPRLRAGIHKHLSPLLPNRLHLTIIPA